MPTISEAFLTFKLHNIMTVDELAKSRLLMISPDFLTIMVRV